MEVIRLLNNSGVSLFGGVTTITSAKTKVTGLLLDENNYALDAPGSYHVSGDGATEIRRMFINPGQLRADDDTSSGALMVHVPQRQGVTTLIRQFY